METEVGNYLFKLDRSIKLIEVFYSGDASRPIAYIRVNKDITEKEFHTEVSYWIMDSREF